MSSNDSLKIVIDNFRVMFQIVAPLTKDSRGIIYNQNMFIAQALGLERCFYCYNKNYFNFLQLSNFLELRYMLLTCVKQKKCELP